MTNKGFYGDKLLAIVLEDTCRKLRTAIYGESCAEKDCKDCEFYTAESIEKWLNAEYEEPEPPLLENGDGLKPGDWIMVKDKADNSDGWARRQFICYKDSAFWAFANGESFDSGGYVHLIDWEQARLPMEGE